MTNQSPYTFRKLDLHGLRGLVKLAIIEGWNPGPHDAEAFFKTDPDGFYGYFKKEELIGGGSLVSYDGLFGFMGFFIMKQAYRRQGLGRKLWTLRRDTLLNRLQPGAPIGMDGVVALQPFYRQGGFELAHKDERYEIRGSSYPTVLEISPILDSDFNDICSYDLPCFGFKRDSFLKAWLNIPNIHTFKYEINGVILGYACLRKVNRGLKICPLFADNIVVAEALFKACLNAGNGELIYIDIPIVNTASLHMAKRFGASYTYECGRMYYGKPPTQALEKVFGVTSFELG